MIRTPKHKKGSALILVTLLTLIMAALAIVALRNVARSTQQAAVFTARQQAQMTSGAGSAVIARRVGDKASNVYNRMRSNIYGQQSNTVGSDSYDDIGLVGGEAVGAASASNRLDAIRAGAYTVFSGDDFSGFLPVSGGQVRLMAPATGAPSFEDQRDTDFRVIIRDPIEAQPAEGFSEKWCFKKVTLATEASVGDLDENWQAANTFARSRSAMDGLIGPIECGY